MGIRAIILLASAAIVSPVASAGISEAGAGGSAWDLVIRWGDRSWSAQSQPQSWSMTRSPGDVFRISGSWASADWECSWELEFDPDPFVFSDINLRNLTGVTQAFSIEVLLAAAPVGAPSAMTGSLSGSVGDFTGNGAELRDSAGASLYEALVDGGTVRTLYDGPQAFIAGAGLTAGLPTQSFIGETGPAVLSEIGIRNAFTLTPGDNAQLTSTFLIIPTPGSGALMLAACAISSRRKRS